MPSAFLFLSPLRFILPIVISKEMVDLDRSVSCGTREQGSEEHLLPERDVGLIGANREVMGLMWSHGLGNYLW